MLAAAGLAGVVYALTGGPRSGWPVSTPATLIVGTGALVAFAVVEARSSNPLLPLALFNSRLFTAANLVTFAVYSGLGGAFFLLPLQLQRGAALPPLAAGAGLLPLTVVMLLLAHGPSDAANWTAPPHDCGPPRPSLRPPVAHTRRPAR
jgi:hypothetical protein